MAFGLIDNSFFVIPNINSFATSSSDDDSNDIDSRIQLPEHYKSLIETTTRLIIIQTGLSNRVNIDTAMNFLKDTAYMLSKPKVLIKAIKVFAVSLLTILAGVFFLPTSVYQTVVSTWRNPAYLTFNSEMYLSNGIIEKSLLDMLGLADEGSIDLYGLKDSSCRQQSICYIGNLIASTFPTTSRSISKFARENLSSYGLKDNKYIGSFLSGFADRDCLKINALGTGFPRCILSFNGTLNEPVKPVTINLSL